MIEQPSEKIKVGCCGWAGSQAAYFKRFKVIEIQITFYQMPQMKTAEKWRLIAPPGFEYTMKAWQLITHEAYSPTYKRLSEKLDPASRPRYGSFKQTPEVLAAWERTLQFANRLGATIMVFQCPASFRPTPQNVANLRSFFGQVERGSLQFVWEPRGDWPESTISELCLALDLIHGVDPFKNRPIPGGFQYFRLHGEPGYEYTYRYTDEELKQVKGWASNMPSYVMFNNTNMVEDAQRLLKEL